MIGDLTIQDIDLLIDAVQAWEDRGGMSDMLGEIMVCAMAKDEDTLKKITEERKAAQGKREIERKRVRERGIVLRAKLIQLRDAMVAAHALSTPG